MNTKIYIGSEVLKKHFNKSEIFRDHKNKSDVDFLVEDKTNFTNTRYTEYYEIPPLWKRMKKNQKYLTLNQLYTLKVSHSYWNIHWQKTMQDIVFLKDKGCVLDEDLHSELYLHWEKIHNKKNVNLNTLTKDFFNKDHVNREYSHDSLHEIVKYYDEPLYKKLLIDNDKPLISKKKYFEMPFIDQIRNVKEEAMTIGLERFYLTNETRSFKVAYMRALKILITSATKGWFPKFIVLNYKEISKLDFKIKDFNLNFSNRK